MPAPRPEAFPPTAEVAANVPPDGRPNPVVMTVTVKLVGGLIHTVGFSQREVELGAEATVGDLIQSLGIDRTRAVLVSRDGWVLAPEEGLADGQRVVIAPVFSGG